MARIRLVADDEAGDAVAAAFDHFDGDTPVLYRALANAPAVFVAYSRFSRALRFDAVTPRALRELVILRVALLNDSEYEWTQHRRMAAAANVPDDQARSLHEWRESSHFRSDERAVLACIDEFHHGAVGDTTFAEVLNHFSPETVVELLMTAGMYEGLARVVQALGLTVDPGHEQFTGGR